MSSLLPMIMFSLSPPLYIEKAETLQYSNDSSHSMVGSNFIIKQRLFKKFNSQQHYISIALLILVIAYSCVSLDSAVILWLQCNCFEEINIKKYEWNSIKSDMIVLFGNYFNYLFRCVFPHINSEVTQTQWQTLSGLHGVSPQPPSARLSSPPRCRAAPPWAAPARGSSQTWPEKERRNRNGINWVWHQCPSYSLIITFDFLR